MSNRASERNEILFISISYVSWFAAPEHWSPLVPNTKVRASKESWILQLLTESSREFCGFGFGIPVAGAAEEVCGEIFAFARMRFARGQRRSGWSGKTVAFPGS